MSGEFDAQFRLAFGIIAVSLLFAGAAIAAGIWAIFHWHVFWQSITVFCFVVIVAAIIVGISYVRNS